MKNRTKNNHYIPQVYLKSWSKENKLYVFEKIAPNPNYPVWSRKNIKSVASGNEIYNIEIDGVMDDSLEEIFSKNIESKLPNFLNRIYNCENILESKKGYIADLVCNMYIRTYSFLNKSLIFMRQNGLPILKEHIGEFNDKLIDGNIKNFKEDSDKLSKINLLDYKIGEDNKTIRYYIKDSKEFWIYMMYRNITETKEYIFKILIGLYIFHPIKKNGLHQIHL